MSCPSRASRRRDRRGAPCPRRSRCAGCGRRASGRRPPRRRPDGGGGRGRSSRWERAPQPVYLRLYRAPVPRNWLTPAAWVAAVAAALLLVFPVGFPNYDTIYALVWGRELAHGVGPDYGSALPPTPHPLTDLIGLVATPLGDGAISVIMVIAYASLGLIGYFVYRLGSLWFDRWIGAVAAAVVLTRAPYLSNGLRAYIDLPYIALCLGALLLEAKRPRAGWPVLALLVPAGLLRPEAWLFSVAYLAYLSIDPTRWSAGTGPGPHSEGREKAPLERTDTQRVGLIRPTLVRARGAFSLPPLWL